MRLRTALGVALLGLAAEAFLQSQAPWKEYPALEYQNFEIPSDWNLRYPGIYGYPFVDLRMRDSKPFPSYFAYDFTD
jgi:hypothetical protein